MYEQREIVLIPFPYSDLSRAKHRPALIISNKTINRSDDRICCLITSNPIKEGQTIDSKHVIEGKLPFQSWVKPSRIFTVDKSLIIKKVCKIDEILYKEIIKSIYDKIKQE